MHFNQKILILLTTLLIPLVGHTRDQSPNISNNSGKIIVLNQNKEINNDLPIELPGELIVKGNRSKANLFFQRKNIKILKITTINAQDNIFLINYRSSLSQNPPLSDTPEKLSKELSQMEGILLAEPNYQLQID